MSRTRQLARVAAFTILLAVGARLSIPFWPVPFTLQTLVVAVIGLSAGPWLGLATVSLYLLLGLAGVPVFAGGGGPGYILTPGFGFLLGFLPAVAVVGLARNLNRVLPRVIADAVAALLGLVPVYGVGVLYFSLIKGFYGQTPAWVILSPFLIYLPGDVVKALVAAVVARRLPGVVDPPEERLSVQLL